MIESLTIDEPTPDTLAFEPLGPDFTFVYTNVDGLWMQRIKSL